MKKPRPTNAKNCVCSKCEMESHSPPGLKHRRCAGGPGNGLRAKHELLDANQRGTWQ